MTDDQVFEGVLVRFPSCRGSLPGMRRREADLDMFTGNGGARKDLPYESVDLVRQIPLWSELPSYGLMRPVPWGRARC